MNDRGHNVVGDDDTNYDGDNDGDNDVDNDHFAENNDIFSVRSLNQSINADDLLTFSFNTP